MDSLIPVRSDLIDDRLELDHLAPLVRGTKKDGSRAGEGTVGYLLVEHKSMHEPLTGLHVVRYLDAAWSAYRHPEAHVNGSAPPPAVIPVVLYHGSRKWRTMRFPDLVAMVPDEREWTPHLSILLQLLKFGHDSDLEAGLGGIVGLVPATDREGREFVGLVRTVGSYLDATGKVDTATLKRGIRECLPAEEGEPILETFAERWVREGTERGIEIGLEKGFKKGHEEGFKEGHKEGRSCRQ